MLQFWSVELSLHWASIFSDVTENSESHPVTAIESQDRQIRIRFFVAILMVSLQWARKYRRFSLDGTNYTYGRLGGGDLERIEVIGLIIGGYGHRFSS